MYKIKQSPEDFVVEELTSITPKDSGEYVYFWLTKREYTTHKAVETIARKLKLKLKHVGFAGTKDKKAVTRQLISIKGTTKEHVERLTLPDLKLEFYGYGDDPISLGDLAGNRFKIIVYSDKQVKVEKIKIPNYFGEQRFSTNNPKIGKLLVKKQFQEAATLIQAEPKLTDHLSKNPTDYIGALRQLPRKILLLYVHSYQSFIWNMTVERMIEQGLEQEYVPIIGFAAEETNSIIDDIMKNENLTFRDFIIRQIPEISTEGALRKMYVDMNIKITDDKDKHALEFDLPKGSYATTVIKELFD